MNSPIVAVLRRTHLLIRPNTTAGHKQPDIRTATAKADHLDLDSPALRRARRPRKLETLAAIAQVAYDGEGVGHVVGDGTRRVVGAEEAVPRVFRGASALNAGPVVGGEGRVVSVAHLDASPGSEMRG